MDLTNLNNKDRKQRRRSSIDLSTMVYGKVPPQAKDLEEAVLGAIMLEKNAFDVAVEILKPECFYVDAHQRIYRAIKPHMTVFYDEKGAVGRRYRRQDEAGTPYCITVDGQTLQDGTVTLRDRDSLKQERIHERELVTALQERIQ